MKSRKNKIVSWTSGSNLTCLGYNAEPSSATATNEVTLGDSNVTTLRCGATTIASLSDERDKTDIENSEYGLDFIHKLRPVEFTWQRRELEESDKNHPKNGTKQVGFIAQELQSAMLPGENEKLDLVYESNPERLEAKQGNLIPILVKAIQDLSKEVETLRNEINEIKS